MPSFGTLRYIVASADASEAASWESSWESSFWESAYWESAPYWYSWASRSALSSSSAAAVSSALVVSSACVVTSVFSVCLGGAEEVFSAGLSSFTSEDSSPHDAARPASTRNNRETTTQ